jgi:signal transduction histidine kinase
MVECEGVEARRKYADGIRRQIAALKSMTQEVLSFARGEESLLLRRVFLNVYVDELAEAARAEVGENGPELVFDAEYADAVRMDSGKISRALLNLVKNAKEALETPRSRAERTAPPRIVVRIRLDEATDQVVFEVEDNGPGIPAAIRATLFEPFVTVGKRHGTGLGLSIVKKIAEQHRGSVDVSSNDQGTVFRLAIPRSPEARPVE